METEKWLIDANALIAYFEEQCDIAQKDTEIESTYVLAALKCCIDLFQNFPTVDAVEVVRCKECIHQHTLDCPMNYEAETYDEDDGYDSYMACNATNPEGFCMCGERRTNEEYVG